MTDAKIENNSNATAKIVLLVATLGSFLVAFMSSSVILALPSIEKEFGVDNLSASWIASLFLLVSAVCVIPFGRLADIYGRKKIYLSGIVVFTAASFLCALSKDLAYLLIFRSIQGLGAAAIFGTGIAMLSSVYLSGERGRAIGINVAAVYVGLSAGPFFGGMLSDRFGWRSLFLAVIPIGAFVVLLILLRLKSEWIYCKGEKFDYAGSILLAIGIVTFMVGMTNVVRVWWGLYLLIFSLIPAIFFVFVENRQEKPLINISIFTREKAITFSIAATLINYSATYAVGYLISFYLQYAKGFSPEKAGFILLAQPLVQAIFSPTAGKISDKIEPFKVATSGMGFTAIGVFILYFTNENSGIGFLLTALIIIGFGFALFTSPNTNAVMNSVSKEFLGVVSGVLSSARLVGQSLSIGISSLVFSIYNSGDLEMTIDYHPGFVAGMKTIFLIFFILCAIGVAFSLFRTNKTKETKLQNDSL